MTLDFFCFEPQEKYGGNIRYLTREMRLLLIRVACGTKKGRHC
jgi:hypothetical protein